MWRRGVLPKPAAFAGRGAQQLFPFVFRCLKDAKSGETVRRLAALPRPQARVNLDYGDVNEAVPVQAPIDTVEFGPFRLIRARRSLERDGAPVALSARAFDMLELLIEARDRVVSRDEIVARVWPGLTVEPSNLTVQMSALRRVLGDGGPQPRFIATIPGRGYRFIGSVAGDLAAETEQVADESGPRRRWPVSRGTRWLWGAAALALAAGLWPVVHRPGSKPTAPPLSIVVMPLRDLSDAPGQGYLADAISDDLTTDLALLPGSTVIARETADSYRGRAVPAQEVGRALGVRYLLEGSMRAEDAMLHINAQLIDTGGGAHVWAQRFDVPRNAVDGARDVIVRRIAAALDVELVAAESARARRDRPDDPTALDLFFQARSIMDHDDTLHGFRTAQALLERSVLLQPDFADALAQLGAMLARKVLSVDDPDHVADLSRARQAIDRALAVSPRNATALAARSAVLFTAGKTEEAAYAARETLAVNRNNLVAEGVLARCAADRGRLDEAAQALQTVLRLNPSAAANKPRLLQFGYVRLLQGRVPEAIDLLQRSMAGDPEPRPGMDGWGRAEGARMMLIAAYWLGGETQKARSLYSDYARLWPHRTVWRIGAAASGPMARLPGFARFLDALRSAGMPPYADEHEDDGVPASATPLPDDDFTPTPLSVPGAETIDTRRLLALRRDVPSLWVLDIGSGAAVMPGAAWRAETEQTDDEAALLEAALSPTTAAKGPVVVLSDGTFDSQSYNAALALSARGKRRVLWYRGGEEAWAAAGQPATDRRN